MEFYVITREQDGAYALAEEDGRHAPQPLSGEQLGRIADRLSSLYWQEEPLPLMLRIYLTAYYSNGETEYISIKAAPSVLLSQPRLNRRWGEGVTLDGLALTLLEGEAENRVWLGADGVVENRGESADKVRQMLELLVEALNQTQDERICLIRADSALSWRKMRQLLLRWSQPEGFRPWLDQNQEEVSWCQVSADGENWQVRPLAELGLDETHTMVRLALLAPGAQYEMDLRLGKGLALYQCRRPWEGSGLPQALWARLSAQEEKGEADEKSSEDQCR